MSLPIITIINKQKIKTYFAVVRSTKRLTNASGNVLKYGLSLSVPNMKKESREYRATSSISKPNISRIGGKDCNTYVTKYIHLI
jgi:hypothetical protein